MKILILGFLLPFSQLEAQTVPVSSPVPTGPVVSTPIGPLPTTWIGAGASYSAASSPKATGWVSYATLASKTAGIYSYTTEDASPKNGQLATNIRSGAAIILRTFGTGLYLLGFGTAGVSQGTSLTSSFSAGGLLLYKFKDGFTIEAGARAVNGTTGQIYEFGIGRTF